MKKEKGTVFVGLSGGVDSSVAALRLKKAGYNVIGVFIKVWHPDFIQCNWEQERLDAMRVAAHLGIPFLTCDAEQTYKQDVADHFISEYKAGRTPNPDVMCNQHVKFGRFLEFAKGNGADLIATGHYAVKKKVGDKFELWRGNDPGKDQSYFLWTLTQEQLACSVFPVGDSPKHMIRQEAHQAKLPVAAKHDSQGICFLGHIDIPDFLSHFMELKVGEVLNENGEVIGRHRGALVYTLGQRHGFTVSVKNTLESAHYVTGCDLSANTITVSTTPPKLTDTDRTLDLTETNWIPDPPTVGETIGLQTRYRQQPVSVVVTAIDETKRIASIEMPSGAERPAAGQSAVLYLGERCLGGGIII